MNIPFDISDLRRMATASSFERGQEYYDEGAVRELAYDGEQFLARVAGTYRYRVTISGTSEEPRMRCTCPYDYGGICKHLVAVGLAMLEGEVETTATYEEAIVVEEQAISPERFSSLFNQVTNAVKIRFLQQALSQSAALRTQFTKYTEAYVGSLVATDTTSHAETIENVKEEVALHLESLTFDEEELFAPDYYEGGGHYDEGKDAGYHSAQYIIQEALEPYKRKIRHYWQQGKLADGMAVLLGVYEGKSATSEPASDPLGVLDSYAETVSEVVQELVVTLVSFLSPVIKSPAETLATIDLLLNRYQKHDVSVQELRSRQTYAFYLLKDFEVLFIALTDTPSASRFLLERLQAHDAIDTDTAFVVLHLAQETGDDILWLKTAEEFAPYEPTIAQLLKRYQKEKHLNEGID